MSAAQNIVNQQQKQSAAETAANVATKPLNPFDGQPPGYNYIGGPQLPPPTNGPQEAAEPRSNISRAGRGSIRRTSPLMSLSSKTARVRTFHKFAAIGAAMRRLGTGWLRL